MDLIVFCAVLVGALLHAGWNAALKLDIDRFAAIILLSVVQALIAIPILPFIQQPARAAWIWIAGAALLHTGYKLFLIKAYQHADLGQVYPIARGTAPLIVAAVSFAWLGETMTVTEFAAVTAISAGVLLMALGGGKARRMQPLGLAFALGTAAFTASYTLFDAVGARIAGTASGFILWMVIGDALLMTGYALATRGPATFATMRPALKVGMTAGAMSLGSYWIAIWAFTQAPVALVAALRETSILFAIVIAVTLLGERVDGWRLAAAGMIALGLVLMRL